MRKLKFYAATILLFLSAALIFPNCKKNLLAVPSNANQGDTLNVLSIKEAKAWFEQQEVNNRFEYRYASEKRFSFKIHFLNWKKAINASDSNYDIVELPVQFDQSPGLTFSTVIGTHNPEKANDVVRLLILKDKKAKTMRSALMHIVSDSGIPDTTSTYGKRKSDFSGFVFFTNLDGSFINGWKYANGKITRKSGKSKNSELKKTSKRINMSDAISLEAPPDNVVCTTYEIDWYERTCTEYTDGSTSCTPWTYTETTYQTYCTEETGDGSEDPIGGGTGYIEHDEPAPAPSESQPDPCATTQATTATNFSTNSNYLSAKTAIQNASVDGKEHEISFGKTSGGSIITSEMSNGGDYSGEVLPVANQFADLHNHPNNEPFDSGDLYGFIDHAVKNSSYTRYVVTTNGTVYALVITDLQSADSFNIKYPRVPNGKFEPSFPESIVNEINEMTQIEGASDEMAMAFILSKYNSGIALLKQDNLGDFKKLNTKENVDKDGNKTYQSNNCQ